MEKTPAGTAAGALYAAGSAARRGAGRGEKTACAAARFVV